jgi:hypothetical protein
MTEEELVTEEELAKLRQVEWARSRIPVPDALFVFNPRLVGASG